MFEMREELDRSVNREASGGESAFTRTVMNHTVRAVEEACPDFEVIVWEWCGDGDARDTLGDPAIKCGCGPNTQDCYDFETSHELWPGLIADEVGNLLSESVAVSLADDLGLSIESPYDHQIRQNWETCASRASGIPESNTAALASLRGIPLSELAPEHPAVVLALATRRSL